MMRPIPILLIAAPVLCACAPGADPPMVGGPCTYDTRLIEATVSAVDADGALFMGPGGAFRVPAEYLGTPPALGATLQLQRDLILEGACTPVIYTVIESSD